MNIDIKDCCVSNNKLGDRWSKYKKGKTFCYVLNKEKNAMKRKFRIR